MQILKKITNSQFLIGTLFYSFPSFISIIISLISVPIFLKYSSISLYSNYLISHFVLTLAILTNLNFGKIATINIAKYKSNKKNILFTSILFTLIISSILTLFLFFFFKILIETYKFENIREISNLKILFGLLITNFYLTFEGIFKGNFNYKLLSLLNLFFYSFSLSLPSIIVLLKIDFDIFYFSLIIKFSIVFLMFILSIKKFGLENSKISKDFVNDCVKNLKWMSLNTTLHQIYNYFDKYLIKIFLENIAFIYYSISQQITSKLGDPLVSYNNVFIAKTNKYKKDEIENLSYSSIFYCLYTYLIFIILYFFLDFFLKIWLDENYSIFYFNLIKIFFLIVTFGSFSKLLVDYYDLIRNSKMISFFELIVFIPFLIGIIFSVYHKNIYYFVYSVFLKEFISLLLRYFYIRKLFLFKTFVEVQTILIIVNSVLWFFEININFILIVQTFHLIIFAPFKKIRRFLNI